MRVCGISTSVVPQYFEGDLESAVTAALREVLANREDTTDSVVKAWLTTLLMTDDRKTVRCLAAIKIGLSKLQAG